MQGQFSRTALSITRAAGDPENFDIAIASDAPYERWFGIEILSMDPSACDLTRLGDGRHPLLLNHCTDDQIGVVDQAYLQANQLRGVVRFSSAPEAQQIKQDVIDKIRQLVSVGYFIEEIVEVEPAPEPDIADYVTSGARWKAKRTLAFDVFQAEMRAAHGDAWNRAGRFLGRDSTDEDSLPTFLVTRWCPFEASVVPVPADVTVGFDRAAAPAPDATQAPEPPKPPQSPVIVLEKTMSDTKTPEQLELERRDQVLAMGEQYKQYLGPNDTLTAIMQNWSRDKFADHIMTKMASTFSKSDVVDMSAREIKRYSLGRGLKAMVTGDWKEAGFERECSEAMSKALGQETAGLLIPPQAFARDFNVGTGSEAGNLVPTYLRDDLFVDVYRNKLVMAQLGARILTGLSGSIDIPRKSVSSTIGTTSEIGSASETNPNTQKLSLSPKRATAYVQVSKQALIQSSMALEGMIRDDLLSDAAVKIEYNAINGVGSNSQPTGIRTASGIGTVTESSNGGTVTWGNIVDLESACANANAEPGALAGYLLNTKQRGNTKVVQRGTNLPFIWDDSDTPLNGYRAAVSNNVPSNLTKGTSTTVCSSMIFASDWSMEVLAFFGAPEVLVDPYTSAKTGQVDIILNQFYDAGVRQPAAFSVRNDLL